MYAQSFTSLAELAAVREEMREKLRAMCPGQAEWLFIALNEAVNNALLHGIQEQQGSKVTVILDQQGDYVVMTVRHDGKGIDQQRLEEEGFDEEFAEGGRGLAIIRQCTDSAEYNKQGTEIVMRKKL